MRLAHGIVVLPRNRWLLGVILTGVCWALSPAPARAALPDELARCAAIAMSDARLACVDALALSAAKPASAGQPAAEHPAPPFAEPPHARRAQDATVPQSIQVRIERVLGGRSATERVSVRLDNGQTWLLLEDGAELSPGDSITIKRAALGSFLLLTPSHRSYRVRRTE